jgi:SAM-dependent methyltransferase
LYAISSPYLFRKTTEFCLHRLHIFWGLAPKLALTVLSLPFFYISYVLLYTYHLFSPNGRGFQGKVHDIIVGAVGEAGAEDAKGECKLLDIGAGSGALLIRILKKYPEVNGTGVDTWGESWDYSRALCVHNAELEGVAQRADFAFGSADKLPFDAAQFDVVVSCLTFHEVRNVQDKSALIAEALRVLKPGGQFIFLDLFADEGVFGNLDQMMQRAGVGAGYSAAPLTEFIALPKILRSKRSLGNAMLIRGVK